MRDHDARTQPLGPVPPEPVGPRADQKSTNGALRTQNAGAPDELDRADEPVSDVVHDASVESFPASDPPSWIGMRTGQPRR